MTPARTGRARIDATFERLRAAGRTGLVTFVSAGDPSMARSADVLRALDGAGADVLEVGVPFSDPVADGPEIQRASERALAAGATLGGVLDMLATVRPKLAAPVVLFTYANPVARMGFDLFARRAAEAGVDGVLALDLPVEEAASLRGALDIEGLAMIYLLSPTTTRERIERAASLGGGFLYGISRLGVTGARDRLSDGAHALASRVRAVTPMPLALGFGISRPEHVSEVGRWADAAVVGSALVRVVAEHGASADLPDHVAGFVRWLKGEAATSAGGEER